jgi:DNA polymerase-3 subunit beta
MKLTCTQENLARGLSIVSHITTKNVNLPILNNVLLKIEDKSLKLSTTNLELAINCVIRGKLEGTGEFTVPSKLFADYVNLLPSEAVDIEVADDNLQVKCGNYETKIKGLPASEFPLIPQVTKSKVYNCSVVGLRKALSQVIFAVSPNESKPEFSGVYIAFNREDVPGKAVLAATDTYRLGEARVSLSPESSNEMASAIIPSRTMAELLRILSAFKDEVESPKDIEIAFSDSQVVFTYNGVELISRVIEGQYPDYQQIVPSEFKSKARLSKEELIKAIKTTSLFSKTGLFDATLELDPAKNEIIVKSTDLQTGENRVNLGAEISGDENNITLNYRYLLEGLNALEGDDIVFKLIDATSPCYLATKDKENEYFYIVMPIKQ